MKRIVGLLIVVLAGFGVYTVFAGNDESNHVVQEQVPKAVKTIVLESNDDQTVIVPIRGIVTGVQEVYVAPKTSGRVAEVRAHTGEYVEKGEIVAVIDGSELWAQTKIAESGLNAAREAVDETDDYFDAQVDQAKKAKSLAKDAYESAQDGGDDKAIAEAKASYEMAKKGYETAKDGRSLQVDLAKGQASVAAEQLRAAQIVAGNSYVRAPFAGVVASVDIEVGDLVSPERALFLLVDDTAREVRISVSGEQLSALGDRTSLEIASGEQVEKAIISTKSPLVDRMTRKGEIKLTLKADSRFSIGTYVDVSVPQQSLSGALVVPREALMNLYHDFYLYTVGGDVVEKKFVRIEEDYGDALLVSGVAKGERIVVEGQNYLVSGDRTQEK